MTKIKTKKKIEELIKNSILIDYLKKEELLKRVKRLKDKDLDGMIKVLMNEKVLLKDLIGDISYKKGKDFTNKFNEFFNNLMKDFRNMKEDKSNEKESKKLKKIENIFNDL